MTRSTADGIRRDVAELRAAFRAGATRDLKTRRQQLLQLQTLMRDGRDELVAALGLDLHKSAIEANMSDMSLVDAELQLHLDCLTDWAKPEKVWTNLANLPGQSFIQPDPLGVVCIIGTWNYPVQLLLTPLVGALSAGNCVLLRLPGEDTAVHTNNALIRLLDKYMDKRVVRYVHGGVDETKAMLQQKFDLIFCTGGEFIGKIVAAEAAKTLTPTVLELGGKSPVIVDETCNIEVSAKRLAWAAFMNCGQTCVRPDYIMVSAKIGDALVAKLASTLTAFFGEDAKQSTDYGRIINDRSYARVTEMLTKDSQYVAYGGAMDAKERYIAPTLLNFKTDFTAFQSAASMNQEVFGPILAIYYYDSLDEAIDFVTDHAKPLAMYVYTETKKTRQRVLAETTSGTACVNDSVVQMSNISLPFGGVGGSGMGAYHGRFSFETFSHRKGVVVRPTWIDLDERYYPYTPAKARILNLVLRPISRRMVNVFLCGMGAVAVLAIAMVVQRSM